MCTHVHTLDTGTRVRTRVPVPVWHMAIVYYVVHPRSTYKTRVPVHCTGTRVRTSIRVRTRVRTRVHV